MAKGSSPLPGLTQGSSGDWIERLARFGYATKGVVYVMIGVLAAKAALGAGEQTTGTQGAILELAGGTFGQIILGTVAAGLLGYAIWRIIQASLDPGNEGRDGEGLVKRAGYLGSGLVYLSLAVWAASGVIGSGQRGGSGGGEAEQEWTARLLSQPFGPWLVGLVGIVAIALGFYHFYKAYEGDFKEDYGGANMNPQTRTWAERIGRFGLSARGVTFCLIGIFLIVAGIQSDPNEARGLGGALQALREQPFGPWLLLIVALGLASYGLYCFSRARYSRFPDH